MLLRRTVPFLANSTQNDTFPILLVDKVEIQTSTVKQEIKCKIADSLTITRNNQLFSADQAIKLVEQQYDACLEFIFSHPFWLKLRTEKKTSWYFGLFARMSALFSGSTFSDE